MSSRAIVKRLPESYRTGRRRNLPPWSQLGMMAMAIVAGDRALMLMIASLGAGDRFGCVAVETLAPGKIEPDLAGVAQVFGDHAHKTVGLFKTLGAATRAGDRFARAWLKDHLPPAAACACPEIKTSPGRGARPAGRHRKGPKAGASASRSSGRARPAPRR